jgi:hypothetical protein
MPNPGLKGTLPELENKCDIQSKLQHFPTKALNFIFLFAFFYFRLHNYIIISRTQVTGTDYRLQKETAYFQLHDF